MTHYDRVHLSARQCVVLSHSAFCLIAVLLMLAASLQAHGQGLVDLGVLPGGTSSGACAINNDGVVVGTANVVGAADRTLAEALQPVPSAQFLGLSTPGTRGDSAPKHIDFGYHMTNIPSGTTNGGRSID